jgi:hypothetical protein
VKFYHEFCRNIWKRITMPKQKKLQHPQLSEDEAAKVVQEQTHQLQTELEYLPLIKVVGLSGAGKSTLVRGLRATGYNARPVSQEHSAVPDLWNQFDAPFILIHLSLTMDAQRTRRADVSWTPEYFAQEEARLRMAYNHAHLRIDTSELTAEEVLKITISYLQSLGVRHAVQPLQPVPSTGSASNRPTGTASNT